MSGRLIALQTVGLEPVRGLVVFFLVELSPQKLNPLKLGSLGPRSSRGNISSIGWGLEAWIAFEKLGELGKWMCVGFTSENRGAYISLPLRGGRLRDQNCLSSFQEATDGWTPSKLSLWIAPTFGYFWPRKPPGRGGMGPLIRKFGPATRLSYTGPTDGFSFKVLHLTIAMRLGVLGVSGDSFSRDPMHGLHPASAGKGCDCDSLLGSGSVLLLRPWISIGDVDHGLSSRYVWGRSHIAKDGLYP